MAIETLLPKKLEKSDASYKSVIELNEALSSAEKEHIRNIALTGPKKRRQYRIPVLEKLYICLNGNW